MPSCGRRSSARPCWWSCSSASSCCSSWCVAYFLPAQPKPGGQTSLLAQPTLNHNQLERTEPPGRWTKSERRFQSALGGLISGIFGKGKAPSRLKSALRADFVHSPGQAGRERMRRLDAPSARWSIIGPHALVPSLHLVMAESRPSTATARCAHPLMAGVLQNGQCC